MQHFSKMSIRCMSTAATVGREVVVVSAARTPVGSFGGSLKSVGAVELGTTAVKAAIAKAGVDPNMVGETFFGNVLQANLGQAPARQVTLGAGLPNTVPCTTVNKVCASGMKAIMLAAQTIALGQQDVCVAGGMESMSNAPFYINGRFGSLGNYGHGKVVDSVLNDGLTDVYDQTHMGMCGERCASDHSIGREEQDQFAIESYNRAAAAWESGAFDGEIAPVTLKKGEVAVDEEFSKVNFDKLKTLRPAFTKDGTITAANASKLNDGASAVVLMSADKAAELGLKPMARIRGYGDAAHEPVNFTTAPSKALPIALQRAGVSMGDIDFHEINEAFSVVALVNMKLGGIDHSKVNVNGGAVALGHPIGSSGSRICVSLLHLLAQRDATLGAASICNGGGGASAIVFERLN